MMLFNQTPPSKFWRKKEQKQKQKQNKNQNKTKQKIKKVLLVHATVPDYLQIPKQDL